MGPRGAPADITPFRVNIVAGPTLVVLILIARHSEVTRESLGAREWESVLSGYRVSVQEDEKILEMDSGDGCTTLNILNATELYT